MFNSHRSELHNTCIDTTKPGNPSTQQPIRASPWYTHEGSAHRPATAIKRGPSCQGGSSMPPKQHVDPTPSVSSRKSFDKNKTLRCMQTGKQNKRCMLQYSRRLAAAFRLYRLWHDGTTGKSQRSPSECKSQDVIHWQLARQGMAGHQAQQLSCVPLGT
jgi:hypothetical protein